MSDSEHTNGHVDSIIVDADEFFTIDIATGAVTNNDTKKISLIQYDHNSERFSFEIDRKIEGHDVMDCNKIQIHYINTSSSSRTKTIGLYEVEDLHVHPENDRKACFTWLISENATHNEGLLTFMISLQCVEGDEVKYRWNSAINNTIRILPGMNNGNSAYEAYADELLKWENYIVTHIDELETELKETFVPQVVDEHYINREFATSEEVAAIFALSIDDIDNTVKILQETGDSTTDVMSQAAVTNSLNEKTIKVVHCAYSDNTLTISGVTNTEIFNNPEYYILELNNRYYYYYYDFDDVQKRFKSTFNENGTVRDSIIWVSTESSGYYVRDINVVTTLATGTGAGSIVQKLPTYTELVTHYIEATGYPEAAVKQALSSYGITDDNSLTNIASNTASLAFGAGSKNYTMSGLALGLRVTVGDATNPFASVSPVAIGEDVTNSGDNSIVVGEDVTNSGKRSVLIGSGGTEKIVTSATALDQYVQGQILNYLEEGGAEIQGSGDSRTAQIGVNKSPNSAVIGTKLYNNAGNSAVFGNCNILGGNDSKTGARQANHFAAGLANFIDKSSCCGTMGQLNSIRESYDTFLFGHNLTAENYNQAFVTGVCNKPNTSAIFQVANGNFSLNGSTQSNAFEVLRDGRAKVYGIPTDDEDVVRLGDMSNFVTTNTQQRIEGYKSFKSFTVEGALSSFPHVNIHPDYIICHSDGAAKATLTPDGIEAEVIDYLTKTTYKFVYDKNDVQLGYLPTSNGTAAKNIPVYSSTGSVEWVDKSNFILRYTPTNQQNINGGLTIDGTLGTLAVFGNNIDSIEMYNDTATIDQGEGSIYPYDKGVIHMPTEFSDVYYTAEEIRFLKDGSERTYRFDVTEGENQTFTLGYYPEDKPTEDSLIQMSNTGTVSYKPISELGMHSASLNVAKTYSHEVYISNTSGDELTIYFTDNSDTQVTKDTLGRTIGKFVKGTANGETIKCIVTSYRNTSGDIWDLAMTCVFDTTTSDKTFSFDKSSTSDWTIVDTVNQEM